MKIEQNERKREREGFIIVVMASQRRAMNDHIVVPIFPDITSVVAYPGSRRGLPKRERDRGFLFNFSYDDRKDEK